ncbi:WhiB family transcriptional regulator [Streptomyces naphthomycinicus]|uniref:WhiB family transcriptional regulator n=1 Tax=Streptomyces naphthomycinicus TaxID=2872625 RepID=UPI001CED2F75|nr:WhiB family transcriptional regulator [Streptomyces sp. TML10]
MTSQLKPLLRTWEWQAEAACRGMDSSVFFSPAGERGNARRRREEAAQEICLHCPVRVPCAGFAAASEQRYGVWGGRTETDRRTAAALRRLHGRSRT